MTAEQEQSPPPQPKDVIDGVPDRTANNALWKYLLLFGAFFAWLGVLLALYFLGRK